MAVSLLQMLTDLLVIVIYFVFLKLNDELLIHDILYLLYVLPPLDESRNAQTVFRDKSGKRRDLDSEREEQKKKAGEKAAKDEKYAQWGKG